MSLDIADIDASRDVCGLKPRPLQTNGIAKFWKHCEVSYSDRYTDQDSIQNMLTILPLIKYQ